MSGRRHRIDFRRSDIRWVTRTEKSHGTVQIEAVLRLCPNVTTSPQVFALGAAVLAGNMYVDRDLCKKPSYMFQVAVGSSDHVTFRTDMSQCGSEATPWGTHAPTDTLGPSHQTFDSCEINLDIESAKPVTAYEEIAEHYFRRDQFTGLITITQAPAGTIELEFPIKHLNLLPSRKMWQFETGPVLFLKQGCAATLAESPVADLLPYFVHANRFDAVEFSPDFPFPPGESARGARAARGHTPCHVQLLVNDK